MASLADLVVRIGADTDDLESGIGRAASTIDDSIGKIGLASAAAGGALEAFSQSQQDVNASMDVTALNSELSADAVRGLATELSDGGGDAEVFALGMEHLTDAGVTTEEGMRELTPVMDQLATSMGTDLPTAIGDTEKVLTPLGMSMEEAAEEGDALFQLLDQADGSVGRLGRVLNRVPEELEGLEFGLEDVSAGIEVFEDRGYDANRAIKEFEGALGDSEGDMDAFLETMGLSAEEWEQYQTSAEPAAGTLEDNAEAADTNDTAIQKLQNRVNDLMFEYGGLADVAGAVALPLIALGPVLSILSSTVGFLGTQLLAPASGFRRMAGSASGAAKRVVAAAGSFVASAARMAASAAATAARVVASWVMMAAQALAAAGRMAAAAMRVVASWVLMGVRAMVQAAVMAVSWIIAFWPIALIIALIVAVVALVIMFWDEIVAATQAAWEWIKSVLSAAWGWVASTAQSVWEGIAAFFSGLWDSIVSAVRTAWDWIVDLISGAWDAAVDFVSSGVASVLAFIQNLAAIPGKVGGWFSDMASKAADFLGDLLSDVRALPGRITSALGNLGSLLVSAGGDLIQGLINGVTNKAGQLFSSLKDLASGALDAAKGALGIASPSKEFADIGNDVGEGFLTGLDAISPELLSEMAEIADGVLAEGGDGMGAGVPVPRDVTRLPAGADGAARQAGQNGPQRVVIDVTGGDSEMKRMIRKWVRTDGRGSVQATFGR